MYYTQTTSTANYLDRQQIQDGGCYVPWVRGTTNRAK